MVIARHDMPVF